MQQITDQLKRRVRSSLVEITWRLASCIDPTYTGGLTVHDSGCNLDHDRCPLLDDPVVDRALRNPPTMEDVRTMRRDIGNINGHGTPHRAEMTCCVYLTLVGSYGDTSYEPPPGYKDEPHEVEMTVYAYFASVNGDWHIDRRMQEDLPGFVYHVGCSHDHHDKTLGSRDCPLFRDSDVYRAICQPPSLRELRVMPYVPDRKVKVPRPQEDR